MKKLILIIFTLLIASAASAQKENDKNKEAFEIIEVWLEAQKDYDKLPGLTAIIIDNQDILWSGAFGYANIEDQLKSSPETIGSICSISKLFTSVAVMQLFDQGKLRLDDAIEDLLPWYDLKQQYPGSGPITVRSLLTHSSGLPRESNHPYWTGPDFPFPSQAEVRNGLKEQETLYPASQYFQYSNLAMSLLGEIVEEVSGTPYQEYIINNIINPLGLSNTRPEMPEELYGKDLAIGYSAVDRLGERQKVKYFKAGGITPAAGFTSNVIDLGKFASWQLRLIDTGEDELLKASTLKQMHNVHWTDPDFSTTWGLGFSVSKGPDNNKYVGHGGSCPGYRSSLQIDLKNKRAYVVIINAGGANPSKYISGMQEILKKAESEKKDDEKEKHDLSDYIGFYNAQPWGSEVYVHSWNGNLVEIGLPSSSPGSYMTKFKHIEGDTFRRIRKNGELGEALIFERDSEGNIIHSIQHGNYSKKIK